MKKNSLTIWIALFCLFFAMPALSFAADGQSLTMTVTPPLFQVTQVAGSDWKSQLRVVNTNNYDIVVTVVPKDFHPNGETGNAVLEETPRAEPTDSHRMSGWIEVPESELVISRGATVEIPFTIHVPPNADPGGHYGALLVSTNPGTAKGGSGSSISTGITSLIFMRIPGDVVEKGSIRDFYTEDSIIETPFAHFILRFENEGNVHLIPQGQIVITNMWGKERGKVLINESSTFGNVLPRSTRKFEFAWNEVDPSPLEVGRYKAVATIVYGVDGRSSVERTIYFWIVPWKPVAGILGTLLFFIWFISWSLRRYIRKALEMERIYLGMSEEEFALHRAGKPIAEAVQKPLKSTNTIAMLKRPLAAEPVTLGQKRSPAQAQPMQKTEPQKPTPKFTPWLRRYRPVIVFAAVVLTGVSLIGWYFVEVFRDERAYHIEQIRPK